MNRRAFLATGGAAGVGVVAGCLDRGSSGETVVDATLEDGDQFTFDAAVGDTLVIDFEATGDETVGITVWAHGDHAVPVLTSHNTELWGEWAVEVVHGGRHYASVDGPSEVTLTLE